ncbi:MAG: GNAT family protein [Deltaproteobacteria bacterium]|nr:GNAT family protein [Deltaproteobacteria bacterium]
MLIGERVQLRAIERADLPTFVRWMNDPHTRSLIARSSPLSMAEEERWFDALLKSTTDVVFVIETRGPPGKARLIGTCGMHKIDWKNRNCAVGIVVGDVGDRGQGYGTDAMACLVRHAFADLGLYRVELEVFPDNPAALKSYERCGFVVEGTRRSAIFKEGAFKDLVLMSVLVDDVSHQKPKPRKRK